MERQLVEQGGPATPERRWLIWSRAHSAFWRPGQAGYTTNLDEAGRYSTAPATEIVDQAMVGRPAGAQPPELMVLAPEAAAGDLLLETLLPHELEAIATFIACTGFDVVDGNSHGALTIGKLVHLLLEDVAWMVLRPGSWEGANMAALMSSHGYRFHQVAGICRALRQDYFDGNSPYDPPQAGRAPETTP